MSSSDIDRLALVEAELERLRAERVRDQEAKERLFAPHQPKPSTAVLWSERIGEAERRAREAARGQQERRYQAQLAASAAERDRLEARLTELQAKIDAERARHQAAMSDLNKEAAAAQKKRAQLLALPEMPEADYTESLELRRQARDDRLVIV